MNPPSQNEIPNPFRRGQQITVPKGTPVRSTDPRHGGRRITGRTQTVTVFAHSPGWVDVWGDHGCGRGFVLLPTVTWPGSSGYWQSVAVTPELCAVNGIEPPMLPEARAFDGYALDVEPCYGIGYDNRSLSTL